MKTLITFRFWGFLIIPFLVMACKEDESIFTPVSCDDIEWNHDIQDDWVNLCQNNSACGGTFQSPIDITSSVDGSMLLDSLNFNYNSTPTKIKNKGTTIEFECEEGSKLTAQKNSYDLKQFHFHARSEHQLNGQFFQLEVHFVHKASDTDYVVIAAFFEEGPENELLAKYLPHFPSTKPNTDSTYVSAEEIDLKQILPANKSFYHYEGSLTTPPCSEVVNWYVLKEKITASAIQLNEFQSLLNSNYREVKPLNGRLVYSYDQ